MAEDRDQRTEDQGEGGSRPPVVESASGTTDPENSSSGIGAYVIFGVAVALLAVLCLGVSSCTGMLGTLAAQSYDRSYGHDLDGFGHDNPYDEFYDEFYDELLSPDDDPYYDFGDDLDWTGDGWFSSRLVVAGARGAEGVRA